MKITKAARTILANCDCTPAFTRREALALASAIPKGVDAADCETWLIYSRPALVLPGWLADDGNAELAYPHADDGRDAAQQYVDDGDWGCPEGGAIDIHAWRPAIRLDVLGAPVAERHDEGTYTIDIEPDHDALIRSATPRYSAARDCAHEWTSEGEGGCDENPGVWSMGGTCMVFREHCEHCGIVRTMRDPGGQRNPGEGVTVSYEMR